MRAMALTAFGEKLEMLNVPEPEAGDGEVVLSVRACGVCRTDLKVMHGLLPQVRATPLPLIPGHEIVGVVDAVGPNAGGWKIGDRAVVYFYVGCGNCPPCMVGRVPLCHNIRYQIGFSANGGYAEKVKVPARNLVRIADHVPDEQAAVVPDAVGTAVHAVMDVAEVRPGERVLVTGAGGVGLHIIQLVRLSGGYTVVADVDGSRLGMAEEMGANETHQISGLDAIPDSIRVDKVIEASGALRDCGQVARLLNSAGRIVLVGYTVGESLTVGSLDMVSPELEIRGCRACNPNNVVTAVELVERGQVRPVIDSVFPLSEANETLEKLSAGKLKARAVLIPN